MMNMELIRSNLDLCEREWGSGARERAVEHALLLAQLLISQSTPVIQEMRGDTDAGLSAYIAALRSASSLVSVLRTAERELNVSNMGELLKDRIRQVSSVLEEKNGELEELTREHKELLDSEQSLRDRERELNGQKEKIKELIRIRTEQLPALTRKIQVRKQELKERNAACRKARTELEQLLAECAETVSLSKKLPDASGLIDADGLIAQAKTSGEALSAHLEETSERLREVIDGLAQFYERHTYD